MGGAKTAPLVVGVDGTRASLRALRWAFGEAHRRGCPVHAIMVWHSQAVLAGPAPILMHPELAPHRIREHHRSALIGAVRACIPDVSAPEIHAELVEGRAADVLIRRSAGAAMLVLGGHVHSHAAEVVLGTTALRCIHRASCPVLIVPAHMSLVDGAESEEGEQVRS